MSLPIEARRLPATDNEGRPLRLMLVASKIAGKTYYFLRARVLRHSRTQTGRQLHLCSLGSNLPQKQVDGLRAAIAAENARRAVLHPVSRARLAKP